MKNYITVAKFSDLQEGKILALDINETPIALVLLKGSVRAFGDICTHDDGPLNEGEIAGNCVICPRHAAQFDLITGKAGFPAAGPIPIYECVVDGNDVKIKL
jgi:3-phenylpropionate/trans-cinnamate dioxygenase ferredoxin subunit